MAACCCAVSAPIIVHMRRLQHEKQETTNGKRTDQNTSVVKLMMVGRGLQVRSTHLQASYVRSDNMVPGGFQSLFLASRCVRLGGAGGRQGVHEGHTVGPARGLHLQVANP